jgi:hypothetical protein
MAAAWSAAAADAEIVERREQTEKTVIARQLLAFVHAAEHG